MGLILMPPPFLNVFQAFPARSHQQEDAHLFKVHLDLYLNWEAHLLSLFPSPLVFAVHSFPNLTKLPSLSLGINNFHYDLVRIDMDIQLFKYSNSLG